MNLVITKKAMIDYVPAQLSEGKDWMIYFYVKHPETGEMKRQRMRINRVKSITERRRWAKKLISDLNFKLASGWNPYIEEDAPKAYHLLTDVIETFMREKNKESKPETKRTYKSYVKIYNGWLLDNNKLGIYSGIFTRQLAINYCSYLYNERNLGERSFNGHLMFLKSMFTWMQNHLYIAENPFEKIPKKKTRQKIRVLIDETEQELLKEFLIENNYNQFYCIVLLAFYGLIRPTEITLLKPKYFDLNKGIIILPSTITKNGKQRIASLPRHVVDELKKINIEYTDPDYFLFGTRFLPSMKSISRSRINEFWIEKVRPGVPLNSKKQFYSLRDSGIVSMLNNGISPKEVMEQADHSSLEVTSVYVKHANPEGSIKIKEQSISL